ncbi:MAG: DNA cytosine methyltransferase [Candidatus Obscuribacterales bacterium]
METVQMTPSMHTFVDLFSGCGGLSLGLLNAGWSGLFAIEKSADAFKTLRHNLVDPSPHNTGRPKFDWPDWLQAEPYEVAKFLRKNRSELEQLRGSVRLVAGGPPCQGFSMAGLRTGSDPRNNLFQQQLKIVDILQPDIVLMENVQGIDIPFDTQTNPRGTAPKSYAKKICAMLRRHGYDVQQHVIRAVDFGVPQFRPRYFTLGLRNGLLPEGSSFNLKQALFDMREEFLLSRRLSATKATTVAQAISDLLSDGKEIADCTEEESPAGFKQIIYQGPRTNYQKLMRVGMNGTPPNSLRLVNHRPETIKRFKKMQKTCRKGVQLSDEERGRFGIGKSVICVFSGDQPAHTLTTLPDDYIHYMEPRIHTVREHARMQSFPDWFEFRGKYTTGGPQRSTDCPRYTQVGNAVPPLLAEAIGLVLRKLLLEVQQ